MTTRAPAVLKMFELKSDLSGGLETAEEEDFGPGKFAKHQKVCLLTCFQTHSRVCQCSLLLSQICKTSMDLSLTLHFYFPKPKGLSFSRNSDIP